MKQLFQYVVLLDEYETTKEGKVYKDTKVIIEQKSMLAKDQKEVLFKVTREIPTEHASDPDNVRILVKNF